MNSAVAPPLPPRLVADTSPAGANFYDYDGAGRLTNHVVHGRTRTFTYDFTGRMTTLTDTNGSVFAYEFDGEGNRLSQSLNDCLSKRFVYDGADVLLELNPTNGVAYAWVNGPGIDQPIERLLFIDGSPRARRVFHTDALGSVAALTDSDGYPTDTYAYTAFGTLRNHAGHDLNRITYTAREHLGDSQGWMYYRHRVYNSANGRFVTSDALKFIDTINSFVYCCNNSVLLVDPLGLQSMSALTASLALQQYMNMHPDFRRRVHANWMGKGNEVGWFYIHHPDWGISIEPWPAHPKNTPDCSYPPRSIPTNAFAEGHTHPSPNGEMNGPSPFDVPSLGLEAIFIFDSTWVHKYDPKAKWPKSGLETKQHHLFKR